MSDTKVENVKKAHIQTFTGKLIDIEEPRPEDIDIFDIAHHLSLMTRYNGACKHFYSIAQHSVLCCQRAPDYHYPRPVEEKLALALLMHDAAEAYVGDIVRGIKRSIPEFAVYENRVMDAINERFDLPRIAEMPGFKVAVKEVDDRMLLTEKLTLIKPGIRWYVEDIYEPYDIPIDMWQPPAAEALFLSAFARFRPDEVSAEQANEVLGVKFNA